VILIVYVDDILLTGSDVTSTEKAKKYLKTQSVIKNMDMSRYSLRIEIAHNKHRVVLNRSMFWIY